MDLPGLIIQKIKDTGPISFRDYMELCLYHPRLGYYTAQEHPTAPQGDFYTCATLTPAFGIIIARQLEEMWRFLGRGPFTIVEFGAGTGALCCSILTSLQQNQPMYDQLDYHIIEKRAAPSLSPATEKKVSWHTNPDDCSSIKGCILSNELLDNLPVHQVVMQDELMEVFVDYHEGFVETLLPATQELKDYFTSLCITLPRNFRTEVNLAALSWIKQVAGMLHKGYVLTIDYGDPSRQLYQLCRSRGTLLAYYKHTLSEALYEHIGRQDITSHINFSALSHWGAGAGLHDCGFTLQSGFLLSLGIQDAIKAVAGEEKNMLDASRKTAFLYQTLLMDMGSRMKVLIQEKGGCIKKLSGLRIAPSPEAIPAATVLKESEKPI